jgi:hypothetical protein
VVIAPPATGPQPTNYTVTLTPIDGGEPIAVICSTPTSCPVTGLSPDTTYLVRCPKLLSGCFPAARPAPAGSCFIRA